MAHRYLLPGQVIRVEMPQYSESLLTKVAEFFLLGEMAKRSRADFDSIVNEAGRDYYRYFNEDDELSWQNSRLFEDFKKENPEAAAVYFIEQPELRRVKIGYTTGLMKRFGEIKTASGLSCRLVTFIPTNNVRDAQHLEASLHNTYPASRIQGEWFVSRDDEGSYIADVMCGVFREWERAGIVNFSAERTS